MSNSSATNLRSPLGRARGLGSAKEGLHHWWAQRITAVAMVPLTLWFVYSVASLASGRMDFDLWLLSPINAAVLEDYVPTHLARTVSILLVKLIGYGLATVAVISTLIVTLGG